MTTHAVIQVRSLINIRKDIRRTLELLRLNRVNHCIILHEDAISKGMLQKVKDYVTWGEIKPEVLARMILTRGKLEGGVQITPAYIKSNTEFGTPLDFSKAVVDGQIKYSSLEAVKPLFRLHPPLKGYEGIKRAYNVGGALGYRGDNINDLILRMLGPEAAPAKAAVAPKAKPAVKKPASDKPKAVKKVAAKKPADEKKPVAKKAAPAKPAADKPKPVKKVAAKKEDATPVKKAVKKPAEKKGDAE